MAVFALDDLTLGFLPISLPELKDMPIFDGSRTWRLFISIDHSNSEPTEMDATIDPLGDATVSGTGAFEMEAARAAEHSAASKELLSAGQK